MAVKIALCQMMVDEYKEKSLFTAESMIREAATQGARIVVLPEMFCCPYKNVCFPIYAEPGDGPVEQRLAALAKELGIYLFGGTIPESDGGKLYNTCFVYGPDGSLLGRHRKVHLFDVNIEGGVRPRAGQPDLYGGLRPGPGYEQGFLPFLRPLHRHRPLGRCAGPGRREAGHPLSRDRF